ARGGGNRSQVVQDLGRLTLDRTANLLARGRIDRRLAGQEEQWAGRSNRMRVRSCGSRRTLGCDGRSVDRHLSSSALRLTAVATARFKLKIVTMISAAPGIDWSGPVIAGCIAFAASSTSVRSNSVNCPISRLPETLSARRNRT